MQYAILLFLDATKINQHVHVFFFGVNSIIFMLSVFCSVDSLPKMSKKTLLYRYVHLFQYDRKVHLYLEYLGGLILSWNVPFPDSSIFMASVSLALSYLSGSEVPLPWRPSQHRGLGIGSLSWPEASSSGGFQRSLPEIWRWPYL